MFKNIKSVISTFFLAEFGRAMYFVVISWLLYRMTNDPFFTGLLVSLGFIPGLLFNMLFGVMVDRLNRKFLSLTALVINTLTLLFVLLLSILNHLNPWIILIAHMNIQLMGSLFRPSIQAYIAEVFKDEELPRIYSKSGSAGIVGGLLGAALGGIITGFISIEIAMLVITICFFLATLSLSRTHRIKSSNINKENKNTIWKDIIYGFSYLQENKLLFSLFGTMLVGQLTFHSSIGFLSVYTIEHLNKSATVYGFLDAILSVGGVVAGMLGTWWWNKNTNHLSIRSLIVVLMGLILLGFTTVLPLALIGVFLIGLGTTWIRVLLQSVQQMITDKEYHGRMASYRMLCNQGSVVITGPLFGWIASTFRVNIIFLILIIPVLIAMVFSLKQAKQPSFKAVTERSA